jgi:predicted O-methyltransferase YrrM
MITIEIWLANQASTHERIVEVGAGIGRSTMVLAANTPGTVWAVDHWQDSEAKQFYANLKEHIESGKVKPARMASVEFATQWKELGRPFFDMTFIDASHDYESVKADILAWKPITRGLLCGHDAGHPPIMQATRELLPGVRHEGSMWVVEV